MTFSRVLAWCDEHSWYIVGGAFGLLLLVGWLVCTDFAMSMDEPPLYAFGLEVWNYLFRGGPFPVTSDWRFHTPVYQMLFVWLAQLLEGQGFMATMIAARFLSFLVFCLGWWSLFFLAKRVTKSQWWALLAVAFFTLSPRMFAHGFYNPKDLPTLTFFTLGVLALVRLLEKPTVLRTVLFGLVTGFAISLRPFALLLPAFAGLGFGLKAVMAPASERRRWALWGVASLVAIFCLMIAVWPLLWHDPLGGLKGAILDNTTRTDEGFYLGQYYRPTFPWHYLPVWMLLTIPLGYSALFATGTGLALAQLRRPFQFFQRQPIIIFALLWLGLPLLAKFMGRIGLFDEWRHVLFVYPAFLLLAVYGAKQLWERTRGRVRQVLAGLVLLQMAVTLVWMVRWHPFEYMYFSVPSSLVKGQMEMDYWGMSYFDGLQWIAAHDQSPRIPIYIRNDVGIVDLLMLPPADQARLYAVKSPAQALYIVDPLRWSQYEQVVPEELLLHTIDVDGLPILWIYRGPYQTDRLPTYK